MVQFRYLTNHVSRTLDILVFFPFLFALTTEYGARITEYGVLVFFLFSSLSCSVQAVTAYAVPSSPCPIDVSASWVVAGKCEYRRDYRVHSLLLLRST